MPADFPAGPSVDDVYSYGGSSWKWNGTYWALVVTGIPGPTGPTGPSGGPTGPTGPPGTGPTGPAGRVTYQPTAPTAPYVGEIWVESDVDSIDITVSDILPPQATHGLSVLQTDGSNPLWGPALPSLTGQANRTLLNNGVDFTLGPRLGTAIYTPVGTTTFADEFDDGVLDPAWERIDKAGQAGFVTYTEGGGVLSTYKNTSSNGAGVMHGLVRPIGSAWAVGDAIVVAARFAGTYATNYIMWGPCLTNGVTHGTSNMIHAEVYSNTGCAGPGILRSNGYTGMNGTETGSGGPNINPTTGPLYLRLVMTAANTWRTDFSPDGVSWWINPSTLAFTITPTHMGFGISNWNTAMQGVVSYEFFRRVSGVS